jgi:hypothetical protein
VGCHCLIGKCPCSLDNYRCRAGRARYPIVVPVCIDSTRLALRSCTNGHPQPRYDEERIKAAFLVRIVVLERALSAAKDKFLDIPGHQLISPSRPKSVPSSRGYHHGFVVVRRRKSLSGRKARIEFWHVSVVNDSLHTTPAYRLHRLTT